MIIIKLKGGLGNQLFQYAFGKFISLKRNKVLKLDKDVLGAKKDVHREYGLQYFNIQENIATQDEIKKNKYPYGFISKIFRAINQKIFKKYYIGYDLGLLKSKSKYFDGYFQSYKYLDPIRDVLLKEIILKNPIEEKYSDILTKIKETESISLHIRRGDYVNDEKTKKSHYVFGLEYYENAIKIINEKVKNPVFFIFSDDIAWVKENLKIEQDHYFVSNNEILDFEELIIMSKCKNNIIANSSFSFWAAWLNNNQNKIVIAPKKWNNTLIKEYKDLLEDDWMKI